MVEMLDSREYSRLLEILSTKEKKNLQMLQESLDRYKDIFQYVCSHVFPKIYTTSEKRGFDLKSNFHIMFKTYRDKMMKRQQSLAKNPANCETEHKETCKFEQKTVKNFDEFSDTEKQEVKQQAKKWLAERREKAEELKAKKKAEIWREQGEGRWNVEQTERAQCRV